MDEAIIAVRLIAKGSVIFVVFVMYVNLLLYWGGGLMDELADIADDRELFDAGYKHVDSMVPRADAGGSTPLWHGWALREAFWKGARWQRARDRQPEGTEPSGRWEVNGEPATPKQFVAGLATWKEFAEGAEPNPDCAKF